MGNQLLNTLKAMSEMYGKELTPAAAHMILDDLKNYQPFEVLKALSKCRKELPRFPTIADIIARIDDGRPGTEEAWSMLPKDEYTSVLWTAEMAEAYGACVSLIGVDKVAARLAFKERYERALSDARVNSIKPKWSASFGFDPNHRETVLLEAIQKNRITADEATKLLPELKLSPRFPSLEKHSQEQLESISKVKNLLAGVFQDDVDTSKAR